LAPVSVSVPPLTLRPPKPMIAPLKVELALLTVSVLLPKATAPAPERSLMEAPLVVEAMSKVPALATPLDAAMLPVPLRATVAPLPMVVPPV